MSNKDFGQLLLSAFYESDLKGYLEEINQYYKEEQRLRNKKYFKISIICFIISIICMVVSAIFINKFIIDDSTVKKILSAIGVIGFIIFFISLSVILFFTLIFLIVIPFSKISRQYKVKKNMSGRNITNYRSIFNFYENGFTFITPFEKKSFRYKYLGGIFYTDHFFTIVIKPKGRLIIPLDKIGDASAGTLKKIFDHVSVYLKI